MCRGWFWITCLSFITELLFPFFFPFLQSPNAKQSCNIDSIVLPRGRVSHLQNEVEYSHSSPAFKVLHVKVCAVWCSSWRRRKDEKGVSLPKKDGRLVEVSLTGLSPRTCVWVLQECNIYSAWCWFISHFWWGLDEDYRKVNGVKTHPFTKGWEVERS